MRNVPPTVSRSYASVLLLSFVFLVPACSQTGVRFADVALNKDLPDDYKTRIFWGQTDAFKYNLTQLAGHVIVGDRTLGVFERGARHVKDGFEPALQVIEGGTVYNSKISRAAAAKGGYLVFAAGLSAEQSAEVTIIDLNSVFIPYEQVPIDKLREEAERLPAEKNVYYVQAVVLASVTIKNFTKIDANASAVKGDTFGADGNVFNQTSDLSKDFKISLTLIDLHSLGRSRSVAPDDLSAHIVPGDFQISNIALSPLTP